jgi:hypothetical protein
VKTRKRPIAHGDSSGHIPVSRSKSQQFTENTPLHIPVRGEKGVSEFSTNVRNKEQKQKGNLPFSDEAKGSDRQSSFKDEVRKF